MEENKAFKELTDDETKKAAGGRNTDSSRIYACPDCGVPLLNQGNGFYECPDLGDKYKLVKNESGEEVLKRIN